MISATALRFAADAFGGLLLLIGGPVRDFVRQFWREGYAKRVALDSEMKLTAMVCDLGGRQSSFCRGA